ncbi:23S rRNA pseudouridine(2605) synthase RluB [Endothiovibrio diazotrophicus]
MNERRSPPRGKGRPAPTTRGRPAKKKRATLTLGNERPAEGEGREAPGPKGRGGKPQGGKSHGGRHHGAGQGERGAGEEGGGHGRPAGKHAGRRGGAGGGQPQRAHDGRRPPRGAAPKRRPSRGDGHEGAGERLQKVLAGGGYGSRREIEGWIAEGRISVDGIIATLGTRVHGDELIRLDGRRLSTKRLEGAPRQVLIYHKPEGEVVSRSDEAGRDTVFSRLPRPEQGGRWVNVGRLDLNTAGLLIFTTDGELAHRLMHPSTEIEREYAVRVLGEVAPETITELEQGVELEDGPARFERIKDAGGEGANHWYHVVIKEGRNREVRRLWESRGVTVSRLIRIRFGPITLPRELRAGRYRQANYPERNQLLHAAGLEPEQQPERSGIRRRKRAP